jgi:hypothetical protein
MWLLRAKSTFLGAIMQYVTAIIDPRAGALSYLRGSL